MGACPGPQTSPSFRWRWDLGCWDTKMSERLLPSGLGKKRIELNRSRGAEACGFCFIFYPRNHSLLLKQLIITPPTCNLSLLGHMLFTTQSCAFTYRRPALSPVTWWWRAEFCTHGRNISFKSLFHSRQMFYYSRHDVSFFNKWKFFYVLRRKRWVTQ